ncbi:MAG: ATP-binding protein, partial [Bacteroidota bacterium]
RNYEGFGLGLTIAQKTIQLMNGRITVESTPNAGSVFTIWLPFKTIK